MKLLTRDSDYAIRALCFMAKQNNNIVSVTDLIKELKTPRAFSRKILQVLTKKNILKSTKGVGGGFTLIKEPKNIYITEIIKIFQGPIKLNECTLNKKLCPNKDKCSLKKKIDRLEKHIISKINSFTLKSLLN